MLIDESRYEYYGESTDLNTVYIRALQQAAIQKAREYWQRGEKEALRPEWVEQTVAGNPAVLGFEPLYVETVRLQNDALDTFKHAATYVPVEEWGTGQFQNPSLTPAHAGRYEFTLYDGDIYHNGDPTAGVRISYVRIPTVSTGLGNPMPLAEYTHGAICERAARILYDKEVPGTNRPLLGGLLDIPGSLQELDKQKQ